VTCADRTTFRGYRVVTASSAAEALEVAHLPERPALILMDLQMVGANGTSVLHSLRSDRTFDDVPINAFTAHALRQEQNAALLDGFDDVIAKPCLPDELITLITPFLDGSRQRFQSS
jgi:CheY-like chemotaxis protein